MRTNRVRSPSKAGVIDSAKPNRRPLQPSFAGGATGESKSTVPAPHQHLLPQATTSPKPKGLALGGSFKSKQARPGPKPILRASGVALLADPILMEYASKLDDFEKVRISCSNQAKIMVKGISDKDGEVRGHGMSPEEPGVKLTLKFAEEMERVEKETARQLVQRMKAHPLYPFVKRTPGLGARGVGRLIGVIGDPYWNGKEERPRMVSELWSYCGVHGPNGSKRKGYDAKNHLWNLASSAAKLNGNPITYKEGGLKGRTVARRASQYWKIYDDAKRKSEGKLHADFCRRCGPSGDPAKPGSPWSDGHRIGHARRIVMKQILLDLWLESKRLYEVLQETT